MPFPASSNGFDSYHGLRILNHGNNFDCFWLTWLLMHRGKGVNARDHIFDMFRRVGLGQCNCLDVPCTQLCMRLVNRQNMTWWTTWYSPRSSDHHLHSRCLWRWFVLQPLPLAFFHPYRSPEVSIFSLHRRDRGSGTSKKKWDAKTYIQQFCDQTSSICFLTWAHRIFQIVGNRVCWTG